VTTTEAKPVARPRQLALIAGVALVVRVGYVVAFMRGYVPNSDADSYFAIGRAVSKGQGYVFTLPFEFVHATAIRPPLYPTVIAGAFKVFGVHVGVAQGVNVVAGSLAAVAAGLIGARVAGDRAGLCAGLVVALYPPLIANDVTVLVESTAVLLLFATVVLVLDGRTVLAGVVLGLLMLDRASAQWFVLVLGAWVVWRFGWYHGLRMVAVAVLVVSPWVIRNAVDVGGPVLVATNGFNLNAIYSNEARTSGTFVDAYFDPRFAAMRVDAADEVDLDVALRKKAIRDLRDHPSTVARVARSNLERWLELRPGLNRHAEALDGRNLSVRNWTLPGFYIVTVAGIVALALARKNAGAQLLLLAAGYFSLVSLVSISVPRLRSIFDGCVALGAGVALAWLIDRKVTVDRSPPARRPLRVVPSVIALAAVAVVIAAAGFLWRSNTQTRAARAVHAAAARDAGSLGVLASAARTARHDQLPRFEETDLEQARDLTATLGQRAPQVASKLKPRVVDALRATRVASHETDVIALLSAAEEIRADADHRQASVDAVRERYERDIRPSDSTLEGWDVVMSGGSLERAQRAVAAL
jgi:4-amino-4-deoxy-L-arabinose transferase-like glycosyltransferase